MGIPLCAHCRDAAESLASSATVRTAGLRGRCAALDGIDDSAASASGILVLPRTRPHFFYCRRPFTVSLVGFSPGLRC